MQPLKSCNAHDTIQAVSHSGSEGWQFFTADEIWKHAYEQEISDASRSLLLALWTQNGRTTRARLESAFARLHEVRAKRYGFRRRPEDYRTAMRELLGTFVRDGQLGSVEALDPSVLDLLNAIVREATDNAVDLLEGACEPSQVQQIWKFAETDAGSAVWTSLRRESARIAPGIGLLLMQQRRTRLSDGTVVWSGPSFEERLALCLGMADKLEAEPFCALIAPLAERMKAEWQTDPPAIIDTIDAVRAVRASKFLQRSGLGDLKDQLLSIAVDVASRGCRSYELVELLGGLEKHQTQDKKIGDVLRYGYNIYRRNEFKDELRECRSKDDLEGLFESLETVGTSLGVNIARERSMVEEALAELEENQAAYEDRMADQWKENRYHEQESDVELRDLFGSLMDDRS